MSLIFLGLLLLGLVLSGLFSGSETGFYRIPRLRLVLDALEGDRAARKLVWFHKQPALFVATVLAGNNLANYLISAATVGLVYQLLGEPNEIIAMVVSALFAPLVFVFGELLPKTIFLNRPAELLRPISPVFFAVAVLLLPLTLPLWALGRLMAWLSGEAAERLQTGLARRELRLVLAEAKAAGVLRPVQHNLAERVFELASIPLTRVVEPASVLPVVSFSCHPEEVLRLAEEARTPELLVEAAPGQIVGYVRVIDLLLAGHHRLRHPRVLPAVPVTYTVLEALVRSAHMDDPLSQVIDSKSKMLGILRREKLIELAFGNAHLRGVGR